MEDGPDAHGPSARSSQALRGGGADFVEVSPSYDSSGITALLAAQTGLDFCRVRIPWNVVKLVHQILAAFVLHDENKKWLLGRNRIAPSIQAEAPSIGANLLPGPRKRATSRPLKNGCR
jgi:hypothetical protein